MSRFTLKQLLPKGPVVSRTDRTNTWSAFRPSGVTYTSGPRHAGPVLPLMPFGIAYDLDLVIVTRHPGWDMHELARLATPEGPVWFAKDARAASLEQSIVSDVPDLDTWLPELPVPRHANRIEVSDTLDGELLDIHLTWENPDGETTQVHYVGPQPTTSQRRRNGSTMGHSRQTLMAALDLSHRDWARRVEVSYDGSPCPLHRLFFIKPFAMALQQTQGGFLTGSYTQQPSDGGLTISHDRAGRSCPQGWTLRTEDGFTYATQVDALRTITHCFLGDGDTRELCAITVTQFGREDAPMHARFSPALPDLRRAFDGSATSRWVLDINGQQSHATGLATASWRDDVAHVDLTGTSPWWVTDRPMSITATCDEASGEAVVRVARRT